MVNYKKFIKHAEKVAKTVPKSRPILKGVEHREDGTLTVTDSYRLYRAYNVNAPRNVVLDAVSGEELNGGSYPEVDRVIPDINSSRAVLKGNTPQILGIIKAMIQAGRAEAEGKKKEDILAIVGDKKLSLMSEAGTTFSYPLEGGGGNGPEVCVRLVYLLEAIEMLHDMKFPYLSVHLYDKNQPIIVKPDRTSDIIALILPFLLGN